MCGFYFFRVGCKVYGGRFSFFLDEDGFSSFFSFGRFGVFGFYGVFFNRGFNDFFFFFIIIGYKEREY